MTRVRRALRHVVALATLTAVGACGIPTDTEFRAVAPGEIPFGLADPVTTVRAAPVTTTITPAVSRPSAIETVTLYYVVGAGLLAAVERDLDKPVSLNTVIASLAVGPRTSEQEEGFRTVVRFGQVLGAESQGGVASVDLSQAFLDLAPTEQRVAIAQLVFTLTARPGVGQVVFELDSGPVAVPLPDGSLVSGPITRELFPGVLITPVTTTVARDVDAAPRGTRAQ